MTTRQRTTANILLGVFAAAMIVAAIVSWRMYDATTAAASERADVTASELADLQATLEGQYDINADYAAQIAALRAQLDRDAPVPATIPSGLRTWAGFTVGEVIVCPPGWEVSIDSGDEPGSTWAACM